MVISVLYSEYFGNTKDSLQLVNLKYSQPPSFLLTQMVMLTSLLVQSSRNLETAVRDQQCTSAAFSVQQSADDSIIFIYSDEVEV